MIFTLAELQEKILKDWKRRFYLQEDSPLFLGRDDKMFAFLSATIVLIAHEAFEMIEVKKIELPPVRQFLSRQEENYERNWNANGFNTAIDKVEAKKRVFLNEK